MPPKKVITKKNVKVATKESEPEEMVEASLEESSVEDTHIEEGGSEGEYDEFLDSIDKEINGLEEMRKELTLRIQSLRKIRKGAQTMAKKLAKKKNNKKNPNKKPSGINAPHPINDISKPLSDFMKKYSGKDNLEQFSRIDALSAVNAYAKEKNLQNKTNKQEINMDATLKKLFPELVVQKMPLKYTGIMGSLGQHFPKKKVVE